MQQRERRAYAMRADAEILFRLASLRRMHPTIIRQVGRQRQSPDPLTSRIYGCRGRTGEQLC